MATEAGGSMQQSEQRIQRLWALLHTIDAFSYTSRPGPDSLSGWQGEGQGQVTCERIGDDELHFIEQGQFSLQGGMTVDMQNRYIWQKTTSGIRLSHGRRGEPVFLFELLPAAANQWQSAQDHLCINDLYSGELVENSKGFTLQWRITGPKKDEHLFYQYSADNL